MKIGTVGFFKKAIVIMILFIIFALLTSTIFLGVLYHQEKIKAESLGAINDILVQDFIKAADGVTIFQSMPIEPGNSLLNEPPPIDVSFPYQELFPHLYIERPEEQVALDKACYLTFDDGPSSLTPQILNTLEQYGIKATFFVTGPSLELYPDIVKAAFDAGHTIAVHSWSHNYDIIYSSVESYLEDYDRINQALLEITGKDSGIFRFPGGSINGYNYATYSPIIAEMSRRGYVFFDWNVSAGDAVKDGSTPEKVTENILNGASGKNRIVVLMHDQTKNGPTAAALPGIIEGLTAQGFTFAPLTNDVKQISYFIS